MRDKTQTTIIPTKEMIEAGAKAAYGTIFTDPENWPEVSCSVSADDFRDAAKNCYTAMSQTKNLDTDKARHYASLIIERCFHVARVNDDGEIYTRYTDPDLDKMAAMLMEIANG